MTPPATFSQVKTDCCHYNGYKPCGHGEDCDVCADYKPTRSRVLIIKLGALGDVVRTTPLLQGIKDQLPGAEIVWLTSPDSAPILAGNPLIDHLWQTGSESLARLMVESFDRVICLDKEPEATAAASMAKAVEKYGYGLTGQGRLSVFNQSALESLRLGLSDEFKFHQNDKTYQQAMFEAAELNYDHKYRCRIRIPDGDQSWADEFMAVNLPPETRIVVGFNMGGGQVFANKQWKVNHFLRLRRLIHDRWGSDVAVVAVGGQAEAERMERVCLADGPAIINTGPGRSIMRFTALLDKCQVLLTGDSLALHLALVGQTACLMLIGSTTHQEIELYGRGGKIVSELDCSPCFKKVCPKSVTDDCMALITPKMVMEALVPLVESKF